MSRRQRQSDETFPDRRGRCICCSSRLLPLRNYFRHYDVFIYDIPTYGVHQTVTIGVFNIIISRKKCVLHLARTITLVRVLRYSTCHWCAKVMAFTLAQATKGMGLCHWYIKVNGPMLRITQRLFFCLFNVLFILSHICTYKSVIYEIKQEQKTRSTISTRCPIAYIRACY